jgi:multicomponent Na+:H+ antiporter subunit G
MSLIAYSFLFLGVFFAIFGNIGVLRFPDVYTRLQASSKCTTTSILSLFIGLMILEGFSSVTLRILVIALFLLITSPVASHVIGRSAYEGGILPYRRKK